MTKITISSLINIMNDTCIETAAVLEGLRKSIFVRSGNELINPEKIEFRIAEKDILQAHNLSANFSAYIFSVIWYDKFDGNKSKNINCRINSNNNSLILCNVIGDINDNLTTEQQEFIELNQIIILKALQEANVNKKYVSMNSCNMWQSTLSRYYNNPHSLRATNLHENYSFDINGTQISFKNKNEHIWFDVYKNIFSKSKDSIYIVREKCIAEEELQHLYDTFFNQLYIEINELPIFWRSLIQQVSKLNLKKQN